jgi:hypothetical protein
MPFNGPIDGNWDNVDYQKAPWTNECMTLTHDECIHCLTGIQTVVDNYDPSTNFGQPINDTVTHSGYNALDWQYAISWETFLALKGYSTEFNTQGVNEFGIVPEPEVEEPEEPTEEEETIFPEEETTPEENTPEVVEENEAPTEETTTEDPAE